MIKFLFIWFTLIGVIALALIAAMNSPLLAWRQPAYIAAGIAGISALAMLLIQPLLATRALPGLPPRLYRKAHAVIGGLLVLAVLVHIGGLYITSPPDVIDVLLLRSPTPFSIWGFVAMWAVFGAAIMPAFRRRIKIKNWRLAHLTLTTLVVATTIIHALLIEGTMEYWSKLLLCTCAGVAVLYAWWRKL